MMARPFVPTALANAAPISFRCELIRRSSLSCYANMPITPLLSFFFFSFTQPPPMSYLSSGSGMNLAQLREFGESKAPVDKERRTCVLLAPLLRTGNPSPPHHTLCRLRAVEIYIPSKQPAAPHIGMKLQRRVPSVA